MLGRASPVGPRDHPAVANAALDLTRALVVYGATTIRARLALAEAPARFAEYARSMSDGRCS